MARRSLKPQLNQIRTWVRQGRTDAWIAHQLEVSVSDIKGFKREHDLAPEAAEGDNGEGFAAEAETDLRAEDDALVAAALDAEADRESDEDEAADAAAAEAESGSDSESDEDDDDKPKRRRRGRRGGRGRRAGGGGGRGRKGALEGTFDHGEEGYGLWLDPAVQDDPVYAEHWAGHRPVTVTVEPDRIVITRTGEDGGAQNGDEDENGD